MPSKSFLYLYQIPGWVLPPSWTQCHSLLWRKAGGEGSREDDGGENYEDDYHDHDDHADDDDDDDDANHDAGEDNVLQRRGKQQYFDKLYV